MEKTFQLNGRNALVILVVGVILVAVRFATVGEVNDNKLTAAIRAELANDMGNNLGRALQDNKHDIATLTELADPANIDVYSTAVSKPLLSTGSVTRAVVKVHYALPEQNSVQEYWLFEHSAIGGWRYRQRSSALSYYLNFL